MARRVLHLIDTGGPGGAETVFWQLVQGLNPECWSSTAVVPELDWLAAALRARGIEPLLVTTDGSFDARYLNRLARLVRRSRTELIHAHLFTTAVYGSLAGRLCGVPVVATFHGSVDVASSDRLRALKFRILDRRRNHLVYVSESLRGHYRSMRSMTAARSHVIHNGIDLDRFTPGRNEALRVEHVKAGEVLIGAVGNVRRPKAYDVLLRAVALLHERGVSARVVIAGDAGGPLYEELLELRAGLGLEDCVTFLGFRDAVQVMQALDVYVLSSSAEGFSLTTVEAMATGLPVVATRCGGPEEIVEHNETGILVPPSSPVALADALERLVRSPAERARLGGAARRAVERRFSVATMIAAYERVYGDCLGINGPRAGGPPRLMTASAR